MPAMPNPFGGFQGQRPTGQKPPGFRPRPPFSQTSTTTEEVATEGIIELDEVPNDFSAAVEVNTEAQPEFEEEVSSTTVA